MNSNKDIELEIRSAKDFDSLKSAILNLLDYSEQFEDDDNYKQIELISERVSNIEVCLDNDNPKINSERLRL